jgi:putative ABC transport system ATP-binding protein
MSANAQDRLAEGVRGREILNLPGAARRLVTLFCVAKRKSPKKTRPRFAAPSGCPVLLAQTGGCATRAMRLDSARRLPPLVLRCSAAHRGFSETLSLYGEMVMVRRTQVNKHLMEPQNIVEIRSISKSYRRGEQILPVLNDISFDIPEGEFLALMGPSGSGKSTLLNLIAGIDKPDRGEIRIGGVDITALSESQLADWRAANVGFVFQFYNLIPVLTAFENVELPLLLTRLSGKQRKQHVETALSMMGLSGRMHHYPSELSGGEQQRVAIARAVVSDPTILVADEPTGDLDRVSADDILNLLRRLNRELGKTIILVTHDPHAAQSARIIRHLDKGVLDATEVGNL